MSRHHPLQNPRPDRKDILPKRVTGDELCNDVWKSNSYYPRGPIGTDLENELGKDHPATDTLILLTEKIAESIKNREYRIGGNTYPLILGHSPLMNAVSPNTRELAVELNLIKRPRLYGNDKQLAPREQVGKTSFWDLGPAAKHYLDMQAMRGLGDDYAYQSSDRNEGIGHAAGIEYEKARLNTKDGVRAESFVRLPNHVYDENYANKVYDIVAFNIDDNSVVETVEVETQTDDAEHIAGDAAKLANAPGESTWSVPNKACGNQMLRAMVREGILTPDENDPGFPHALATNIANDRIKDLLIEQKYRQLGEELPINEFHTFNASRKKVRDVTPDVLSVQAAELRGDGQ